MDLTTYDIILINTSGGKDSQSMLDHVHKMATEQGVTDRLVAVHANLGRMEWEGTEALAREQVASYGVRFEVVSRPQGNILDHVRQRGMWPSSTTRYCTSDHKRGQVGKVITKLVEEKMTPRRKDDIRFYKSIDKRVRVLSCMGFRAQESPARAKRQVFEVDKRNTNGKRHVDIWLPIHDWTEDQVWASIKASGVRHHPAYDLGMPRLSCVFCIFAPKAALVLAGKHNLELLDEYVAVEKEIDHTFRVNLSMAEVKEAVESDEPVGAMTGAWNM